MSASSVSDRLGLDADSALLWDVLEEHLDEAGFCLFQFERLLDDPLLTLADLQRAWEPRWVAHVDALALGGGLVLERLLAPALEAADAPELVTACGLALLASEDRGRLLSSLRHPDAGVRQALARACALMADPGLTEMVRERLRAADAPEERAGLLEVLAASQVGVPDILPHLRGDEAPVLAAAVRVARFCDGGVDLVRELERELAEGAPERIEPAAIAALALGSPTAFSVLEQRTLDRRQSIRRSSLALLAALGGPPQHARLLEMASDASLAAPALFALGYSGNLDCVPALLERTRSEDVRLAKLALQSLALIVGIHPGDPRLQPPEPVPAEPIEGAADEAPPPVGEDDLDLPDGLEPEDELPSVDPERLAERVQCVCASLEPGRRYLAGQPYGEGAVIDLLEHRPMGWRHVWANVVLIATRGQGRIDTRARARHQMAQLAALRARPAFGGLRYPLW